jgi:hypothetical protein
MESLKNLFKRIILFLVFTLKREVLRPLNVLLLTCSAGAILATQTRVTSTIWIVTVAVLNLCCHKICFSNY